MRYDSMDCVSFPSFLMAMQYFFFVHIFVVVTILFLFLFLQTVLLPELNLLLYYFALMPKFSAAQIKTYDFAIAAMK